VIRTSDNKSFLATKIPDTVCKDVKSKTKTTRLADVILPTAAISLSRILNHPNIISIIDIIRTSQLEGDVTEAGEYGDITIWEDMDAGALSYLLPLPNTYPALDDEISWHALASQNFQRFSLPEGLCWHVLRSISRALLWLHYGVKETEGIPGEWMPHDEDWQAILIMEVSPSQIWFKRPRGGETYGECKLGGFGKARVCGSLHAQVALAEKDPNTPLIKQYFWAPVNLSCLLPLWNSLLILVHTQEVAQNIYSPSRSSEIWSLGATIYTMMTGIPPPRFYDYDWQISRMNDKNFSQGLRDIVASMLKPHPGERPRIMEIVNEADDQFAKWRATTKEGAYYVDITDKCSEKAAIGLGGGLIM
jgi:serine/threonine protein kinase